MDRTTLAYLDCIRDRLLAQYCEGASLEAIAVTHQLSPQIVRSYLLAWGVSPRALQQARTAPVNAPAEWNH